MIFFGAALNYELKLRLRHPAVEILDDKTLKLQVETFETCLNCYKGILNCVRKDVFNCVKVS